MGLYDAHKAIELNPAYEKGWWRRAEACEARDDPGEELYSWMRALHAMGSPENQSPAQAKLRLKFITEIVRMRVTAPPVSATDLSSAPVFNPPLGRAVCEAANTKYHNLKEEQRDGSSSMILAEAYAAFKRGVDSLKKVDPLISVAVISSVSSDWHIKTV
ncbi:hypothetical protein FA95DRAFT_994201 [Auriscalpium vulgare]|uniref:Uncharacterized protein n=1 Tax=Auriscalpium vulgare TaxID=40419 RepID=A0ACB8R696_9AGAM|nr:hypothetical protein FA95DRAFT_994201 [Auriscalpium vulgare]